MRVLNEKRCKKSGAKKSTFKKGGAKNQPLEKVDSKCNRFGFTFSKR
jgi:hypothetical protein